MHIKNTFITKKLLIFRYLIKVIKQRKFNVFFTLFKHLKKSQPKKRIQKKASKENLSRLFKYYNVNLFCIKPYSTVTDFAKLRG